MRQLILLVFSSLVMCGCSKKEPPAPPVAVETKDNPAPDTTAADRAKLLKDLKSNNQKTRREAAEELSAWIDSDPESIAALLELLKDKTTAGLGKTHPTQITSTREAAVKALFWGGPKGEAALKEKGFAILREGLADSQPAIREHTAYTIGLLGPLGRPLSPDVMKLCTDPDANVRGRAFDALSSIGVTDITGFVALLNHENRDIGQLAAELVPSFTEIPSEAVPALTLALVSENASIRRGGAAGIATAGPKAADSAKAVSEAIKKTYPPQFDFQTLYSPGSEMVFWRALVRIGAPAVTPTAELLTHSNLMVCALAAKTLGDIGPPAKPAVDKLKAALQDSPLIDLPVAAACSLCAIGEGKEEAVALIKRYMENPNVSAQLAIEAIPRMGEAGKPLIPIALGKLGSEVPFARFAAVGLIGTLPPAEAAKYVADLGKLTADPVPVIRYRAGIVLEKLGPAAGTAADALGKAFQGEKDENVRDQFLAALIAMGPAAKPALPVLLSLVRDKSFSETQRIRVIAALPVADPASKEVLAVLMTAAEEKEQYIRSSAATALGKLDPLPPDALARLVGLAQSDRDTGPRFAAIRSLALAGARAKGARAEVEKIATGPQPGLALWAKVGLAAMDGDAAKAGPIVRSALMDKVPTARSAAASALLVIGPLPDDLPTLIRLAKDVSSTTRQAVAKCLGALGPKAKEAVPQLLLLMSDVDGDVRIAAVEAVSNMGAAALPAIDKLTALLRDPLVKSAAAKALEKLEGAEKK